MEHLPNRFGSSRGIHSLGEFLGLMLSSTLEIPHWISGVPTSQIDLRFFVYGSLSSSVSLSFDFSKSLGTKEIECHVFHVSEPKRLINRLDV